MHLVIPMSGLGTRFRDVGVLTPKPLIPIYGIEMFKLVTLNVLLPEVTSVTYVTRREFNLNNDLREFESQIQRPINNLELDETSEGPADSVNMAIEEFGIEGPVLMVNSDQFFSPSYDLSAAISNSADGLVLTMYDQDPKWSYAEVVDGLITRIVEKQVISKYATTGLYYFSDVEIFTEAFREMKSADDRVNNELYVGPSYNYAIRNGKQIDNACLGNHGEAFWGIGTPSDLSVFLNRDNSREMVSQTVGAFGLNVDDLL